MGSFWSETKDNNIIIVCNGDIELARKFLCSFMNNDVEVEDVDWQVILWKENKLEFNFWIAKYYKIDEYNRDVKHFFYGKGHPIINLSVYLKGDDTEVMRWEYDYINSFIKMEEFKDSKIMSIVLNGENTNYKPKYFSTIDSKKAMIVISSDFEKEHFINNIKWLLQ